jgi:hypothetical protein
VPASPFVYQRPVGPDDLIDREREVGELLDLVDGGQYARLVAPRRYGKTTVLGKLAAEAERTLDMTTISVDFSRVMSLSDGAIRVEAAYRGATDGPVKGAVRDLVRSWNIGVSLGAGGLAAQLQANPKTDPLPALHRLLELPREAFERTGRRTLVIFDEAQDMLRIEGLDGIVRSHIQHHGEAASYVFSGSEPGMMETLFGARERPLFGQAHPVDLGPLPDVDLARYVEARFADTGRDAGEALDALLELVAGHPQRAMLLAHYLWERTAPGSTATISTWAQALDAAIEPLGDGFDRFLGALPKGEQRVLLALALAPQGLYSNYVQQRFGLRPGSARDALRSLVARGEVVQRDGAPQITDPLLRWWLRERRYPDV